jgi:PIN domain nuclease of toxin-antitoxin system
LEIAIKKGFSARLLIAQAIAENRQMLTRDELIFDYGDVSGFDPLRA